jgi:hypothetical protein
MLDHRLSRVPRNDGFSKDDFSKIPRQSAEACLLAGVFSFSWSFLQEEGLGLRQGSWPKPNIDNGGE